jgi:hypothetical protein
VHTSRRAAQISLRNKMTGTRTRCHSEPAAGKGGKVETGFISWLRDIRVPARFLDGVRAGCAYATSRFILSFAAVEDEK